VIKAFEKYYFSLFFHGGVASKIYGLWLIAYGLQLMAYSLQLIANSTN
jgi:hypothetical protein